MNHNDCRHEPCRCGTDGQDFCGDYCEQRTAVEVAASSPPDEACGCGHTACASDPA